MVLGDFSSLSKTSINLVNIELILIFDLTQPRFALAACMGKKDRWPGFTCRTKFFSPLQGASVVIKTILL
jgi:hypothetical protein